MSEVPLYLLRRVAGGLSLQGYLAHHQLPPLRTLRYDYAEGPMVVLGGALFLMSEVSLYKTIEKNEWSNGSLLEGGRMQYDRSILFLLVNVVSLVLYGSGQATLRHLHGVCP